MKCVILLALIAVSYATPLLDGVGMGGYVTPGDIWSSHGREDAHQFAHKITQGAVHDQLAHTQEAIKGLEYQLTHHPHSLTGTYDPEVVSSFGKVGPSVATTAIHHLQEDLENQKHHLSDPEGSVTQHLHDTVEAGVGAQVTVDEVRHQLGGHMPTVPGLHAGVFQSRLRKLIDEHNEQEIEKQISHHHHWAQQLHHQQQFVSQQKHQIEAQQVVLDHQGIHDHHLEQAHHHLQMQEYYLIHEQLAHHLAILQLQEALVHKEKQVLEDTVAEHVHEEAVAQRDVVGGHYGDHHHHHHYDQGDYHHGLNYGVPGRGISHLFVYA